MDERATGGVDDAYALVERLPTVEEFLTLRDAAGMAGRSPAAVERGLPNSLFGVVVVHEPGGEYDGRGEQSDGPGEEAGESVGETVAMGRVVGDGGSVFHVCDMAVHPAHQRRGLGTRVMEAILGYLEVTAPPGAYVNLMADVDGFYERFGFEETRPASKGMFLRTE